MNRHRHVFHRTHRESLDNSIYIKLTDPNNSPGNKSETRPFPAFANRDQTHNLPVCLESRPWTRQYRRPYCQYDHEYEYDLQHTCLRDELKAIHRLGSICKEIPLGAYHEYFPRGQFIPSVGMSLIGLE